MAYVRKELYCLRDWRGKEAPSFTDADLDWVTTVPPLSGKIILLEFWSTRCKFCQETVPLFNEIHRDLKDDVAVVGIAQEVPDAVRESMKTHGIDYYVASDKGGTFQTQIGIKGVPNVLVVDHKGIVRWQGSPSTTDAEDPFNKDVLLKIIARSKIPLAQLIPITEDLIFSSQPTEDQLRNVHLLGIKSVLNLRCDDENGFIKDEDKLLFGSLKYAQVPIQTLEDIGESNLKTLLSMVADLPKPCLVHCNLGLTAGATVLLKAAEDEKNSGKPISREQFLEWGSGIGFNFANYGRFFQFLGAFLK